jgi:hypothetical protein
MDIDAKQQQYRNELAELESYLQHPISSEILRDNREREEQLINVVCRNDVVDIESFFAHFAAIGELKGLRRARVGMEGKVEELKETLKELQ